MRLKQAGSAAICQRNQLILNTTLDPTEFFHCPRCVPDFLHALDFLVSVHFQNVDVMCIGLFIRGWNGPAVANVTARKSCKVERRSVGVVIGRRMQVITATRCGVATETRHPIDIVFDSLDIDQWFALREECGTLCNILFAFAPSF